MTLIKHIFLPFVAIALLAICVCGWIDGVPAEDLAEEFQDSICRFWNS